MGVSAEVWRRKKFELRLLKRSLQLAADGGPFDCAQGRLWRSQGLPSQRPPYIFNDWARGVDGPLQFLERDAEPCGPIAALAVFVQRNLIPIGAADLCLLVCHT